MKQHTYNLEIAADGTSWTVTQDGAPLATYATIGQAFAEKAALVRAASKVSTKRTKAEIKAERQQGGQRV